MLRARRGHGRRDEPGAGVAAMAPARPRVRSVQGDHCLVGKLPSGGAAVEPRLLRLTVTSAISPAAARRNMIWRNQYQENEREQYNSRRGGTADDGDDGQNDYRDCQGCLSRIGSRGHAVIAPLFVERPPRKLRLALSIGLTQRDGRVECCDATGQRLPWPLALALVLSFPTGTRVIACMKLHYHSLLAELPLLLSISRHKKSLAGERGLRRRAYRRKRPIPSITDPSQVTTW
jgi:hypothetical protein